MIEDDGFHHSYDHAADVLCQKDLVSLKQRLEDVKKESEEYKERVVELKKQIQSLYRKFTGVQGGS
jgi:uncharacterized coiled-coil DUF342 family protein